MSERMNACMHTVAYSEINITTRMRMHAGAVT